MRRKGFSSGWWWGWERDFSLCGVGDGSEIKKKKKKEKQWSPVGCVQRRVFWFCCRVCASVYVYFPAPHSLLLCLCCNVLLLCVLLPVRGGRWLANWVGRALHGSHCNASLSYYPLQERSPGAPLHLPPLHLYTPSLCPPFSSCSPLLLHTHAEMGE